MLYNLYVDVIDSPIGISMKNLFLLAASLPAIASANVELEPQQVTANRIIESQISNSFIVSREDIEKVQASNLSDILSTLPGFQFTKQGGNANTQSFSMNGFRSNNILILLNGQRFSSATLGETTFNTIPADIIQRIEIVSNARSAIYGADALGGVINIITVPEANSVNSVQLALGNQRTNQFSTNLNKTIGNLSLNLSGFSEKTHGFDVKEGDENDSDGSERHSLALGSSYKLTQNQTLSANIQTNRGMVDFDKRFSSSPTASDYQQQAANLKWEYTSEKLGASVQAGQSSDKSWSYGNGTSRYEANAFVTENKTLETTLSYAPTKQQTLMLVADYREEDVSESDSDYDKDKGDVNGIGISHRFNTDTIGTEIGIRRDDATRFDENYSQSLSVEWYATQRLSVVASINTGFKAPSFNDLYYPSSGNPDLRPEESINRRVSAQYSVQSTEIEASYQYYHIENKIDWRPGDDGNWSPVNVDNVLLRTASISWKQFWSDALHTQLSYDWTHAIDLETHNILERQAPRNIKLSTAYNANGVNLGTLINYLSDSYDDERNNNELAAYAVVDLFASYDISSNFQVGARVNNALDREYQTAKGYPASELTYLIDGTFKF